MKTGYSVRCRYRFSLNFSVLLIAFIIFLSLAFPLKKLFAQSSDTLNVLVLNSYHQGYEWTDEVTRSIREEFAKIDRNIQLSIEYMDTKHYHSPEYFEILKNVYYFKYHNVHFDLIIVSDNYALEFMRKYRNYLFPKIPIVFCGIDNFTPSLIEGLENITGIVEDYNLKETIELGLKLHPDTKTIVFISDSSPGGQSDLIRFQNVISMYKKDFRIIEFADWTVDELVDRLIHLPRHAIVIRFKYEETRGGKHLSDEEKNRIWQNCPVPIYTTLGQKVEHYAIGGIINTPDLHGQAVVRLAKRIFMGESADSIPIVLKSPSVPMFDYMQLKKFHITKSSLPSGSIILNRPFSFYQQYKILVWSILTIFSVLSVLVILLSVNIVNRRQAEKALKENEEKYRLLIETVPHGILEIDMAGKINFANTALQKILLYSKKELLGKTVFDLVPPEYKSKTEEVLNILAERREKPFQIIGKFRRKDGSLVDIQLDWNFKRDPDGAVNGIISVVSDISKRLQAEREAKIRQEQLIQADKMVALGTLVSGVAHEINNPNNFIMINIPILERAWKSILPILDEYYENNGDFKVANLPYKQMKAEFQEICSDILEGSQRINAIIKDLKKYSRKSEVKPTEYVDVNKVISSCIHLLGNNIQKFTDNFQVEYDDEIPLIRGNFQHFEQIIINLIQNACQSLPDRSKGVFVSTAFNKSNKTVEIQIRDEGVGIESENLNRIFDPFFTTKRDEGGTGLGLFVSNNIIQKYGGQFKFSSTPGEGTIAKVIFPLKDQSKEES